MKNDVVGSELPDARGRLNLKPGTGYNLVAYIFPPEFESRVRSSTESP